MQLWTCEEQRRLEELLIEYPPEPIEMRRFAKIAKALGNRTARQVASRLQKYFQKLHAAGLPVPGRIPRNTKSYISVHRKNRLFKQMIRPTTFFPSNYVPFTITDEDENNVNALDPTYYRNGCNRSNLIDDAGDGMIVVDEPESFESNKTSESDVDKAENIIQLIKRVQRDKAKAYPIDSFSSEHNGFKVCFYYFLLFLFSIDFYSFPFYYSVTTAMKNLFVEHVGIVCRAKMNLLIIARIV